MATGFVWYGLLFVKQWAAGNDIVINEATHSATKNGVELPMDMTPMFINVVAMVIYAVIINWVLQQSNRRTWAGGGSTLAGSASPAIPEAERAGPQPEQTAGTRCGCRPGRCRTYGSGHRSNRTNTAGVQTISGSLRPQYASCRWSHCWGRCRTST